MNTEFAKKQVEHFRALVKAKREELAVLERCLALAESQAATAAAPSSR